MRIAKMLGLAVAACALMAAVAAASASALTVTSCEGTKNCKTATVGTTFNATGSSIKLSNGFLTNTCNTAHLGGTITDVSSLSSTDLIDADITSAAFTECNFEVHVEGLPWTLETNSGEFPAGKVTGVAVTLTVFGESCTFAEDATHTITATWNNGSPSSVTLGGSMVKTKGSDFICGTSGSISGTYTIKSVSDPNNTKANNLRID